MTESDVLDLAYAMADRLVRVDGVRAVVLGGSWARGDAHPNSDLDLGLYHGPADALDLETLQAMARDWDDRHRPDVLTPVGGWGPWINGGGWLTVREHPVDWLYRDVARVEEVVAECLAGRPALHHQPGHPHGFQTHIYLGELHHARVLADPDGVVAALKARVTPYPPALKQALIEQNLWQAGFAIATARKSAERGEAYYVAGSLFRAASCLTQVLFALNERHFMNEKGSVALTETFARRPADFAETIEATLGAAGTSPQALMRSLARLQALADEVGALAVSAG